MKRLTCAPRTPEWHAIRADSWTASTAAVLVAKPNAELLRDCAAAKGIKLDIEPLLEIGIESYFDNTLWKAWAEKNGRIPRFMGNAHTERGNQNEERVIRFFEDDRMLLVEREVTATSLEHDWLLASFDAVAPASSDPSVHAPNGFPIEAKCPAFHSRKKLWDARKTGDLAIMGLPYYWCQVQHQMLVAQAPYAWFVAAGVEADEAGGEKVVFPIVEKVPRDDRFLVAYQAAAKFFFEEYIYSFVEPPKLASDEALLKSLTEKAAFDKAVAESDHAAAVDLYLNALREEEAAAARRKELEAKVISAAAALRAEGSDAVLLADRLQVTYTSSASVSWQKVAKELVKVAGLPDIPSEVITACTGKPKESVKLKEVS